MASHLHPLIRNWGYIVKLATQPTANVTVTVAGSSDVTVAPILLTFTNSNWIIVQTVTVTAAEDTDMVDDTATLNHAASGGGYDSVTGSVTVTVDDEAPVPLPATAGEDYTAASGTLIFAPGETSKTISLQIIDEPLFEQQAQDLFRAVLSNPSGATIAAGQGRLLFGLVNGDPLPPVSVMAAGLASTGSPGGGSEYPHHLHDYAIRSGQLEKCPGR